MRGQAQWLRETGHFAVGQVFFNPRLESAFPREQDHERDGDLGSDEAEKEQYDLLSGAERVDEDRGQAGVGKAGRRHEEAVDERH